MQAVSLLRRTGVRPRLHGGRYAARLSVRSLFERLRNDFEEVTSSERQYCCADHCCAGYYNCHSQAEL
jgi:hypothetical protein